MRALVLVALAAVALVGCGPSAADLMAQIEGLRIQLAEAEEWVRGCEERAARSSDRLDFKARDESLKIANDWAKIAAGLESKIEEKLRELGRL